jgi:MFS family permease
MQMLTSVVPRSGIGAGVFFIGYFACMLPSNLLLARVGARRWLAVLAVAWGCCGCAMAAVRTVPAFFAVRFFLGAAESGARRGTPKAHPASPPPTWRAQELRWL